MKANTKILVSLAGMVLLVLAGVAVLLRAYTQIEQAGDSRQRTYLELSAETSFLSALKDAETGYRGYLLTREEAFLEPYQAVQNDLGPSLEAMRNGSLDGAARARLDAVAPIMATSLANMREGIDLRRRGKLSTADMEARIGQGKLWMDRIRAELEGFAGIEREALARRVATYQTRLRTLLGLICATSALSLVLAFLFAFLFYREAQRRIKDLVLQETRKMLERQKELNHELQLANATLQASEIEIQGARLAAERASLAKSEFLSSMSHELRTPLNAILGFAQLMDTDSPPPAAPQKRSLAQILKAGWHLLTLINEVLDLAKVESGRMPLSKEPVNVDEVLGACRDMIETQAAERGLTLIFPPPGVPRYVLADRTRMKQVLLNLLSNAVKYNTAKGSIEVRCLGSGPGHLRVSVRDQGPGLGPEHLAQLFQAFNRLEQGTGKEEGSGIGLVLAKRLVELMGGVIGVESKVGVGSEFWFDLPEAPEPRLAADGIAWIPLSGAAGTGAPVVEVLYVEDNPANLALVEQLLARHPGIHLSTAVEGQAGLDLARAAGPALILMDINLPGMSGYEALAHLRADPLTAGIPVIAISANAMESDRARGLKAGFARYITKPIRVDEFMEALQGVLVTAGKARL